jgi:LuxR family maltose regulon positive regulatory protein
MNVTVPAAPPGMMERPRLAVWLERAAAQPVILLCAPAGSGKTSLLSSWTRRADADRAVAWLTVEPGEDADFWTYLHAALTTALDPGGGRDAEARLPAPGEVPDSDYPGRLALALTLLPRPVTLVIDDVQEIGDPQLLERLAFVIRRATGRLRVVLSTRAEPPVPLRRWQVSGELSELRGADLAFTPHEAAALLRRDLPTLDDAETSALHARTEGWAAGLRFAYLALRGADPRARLVERFGGSHGSVADYLREEVLAVQPAEVVDALLCSAVLDRMCGGLLDALTGRDDGARTLAALELANAFVVPLAGPFDRADVWYRHHQLFAGLLFAELQRRPPRPIGELHRRAAEWYAAHEQPVQTLHHALGAQDWRRATDVLREHWRDLMICGRTGPLRTAAPAPEAAVLKGDPELALAFAVNRLNAGDLSAADGYLRLAGASGERPTSHEPDRFDMLIDAFKVVRAQLDGAAFDVRALAPRLLADADHDAADGDPDGDCARAIALTALGDAGLNNGDVVAAEDALSAALDAATRAGFACQQATCTAHLAVVRAVRGTLHAAGAAARSALAAPACSVGCHVRRDACAHLALAAVHFQQGRVADARRHLELSAGAGDRTAAPLLIAVHALLRSRLLELAGEPEKARQALLAGRGDAMGTTPPGYLSTWLVAAEADLLTRLGDTRGAQGVLAGPLSRTGTTSAPLIFALARLRLRDGDPEGATRALRGWADDPNTRRILWLGLDGHLLTAVSRAGTGETAEATHLLERCLDIAEPERFRHVFLQTGPQLHDLLVRHLDSGTAHWFAVNDLVVASRRAGNSNRPDKHSRPEHAVLVPLTDRELSVLRYLPSALTNAEIAAELYVSVHTVKTHVQNVFRKLEVTRRREAVRRARDLKLL